MNQTRPAFFDLHKDPHQHFLEFYDKAKSLVPKDPNAMSLATVSEAGVPSARVVLYKGLVRGGFSFYTNYHSPKAQDLLNSRKAALLFYWPPMDLQIRITGVAEKLSREESETYFQTRARLSQLGAWASDQSQKIADSSMLQKKVDEFEKKFAGKEIPCPPHWGGFHVLALSIEFWFGQQGRLHDRYKFMRESLAAPWQASLLSP